MRKILAAILATAMTMSMSAVAFAALTPEDVTIGGSFSVGVGEPKEGWGVNYSALNIGNKSSIELKDATSEGKQYVYSYGGTEELNVVLYNMPGDANIHVADGKVKVSTKKATAQLVKGENRIKPYPEGTNSNYYKYRFQLEGTGNWFTIPKWVAESEEKLLEDGFYVFNIGGQPYFSTYKYGRVLTIKDDHGLNDLGRDDFKIEVDVDNGVTFFLKGESAYSNIREVSDDDRLANKDSDDAGCVYDFNEKITETARIRANDYVDLYFKGNYGTDKENLRVWTDEIDAVEKYLDDADVDYYDFRAHPKFASSIKVIIDGDPNSIVYEYKDGEIARVQGAKYESDGWAFTTKVLGTYFLTEEEYAEGSVDAEETPDVPDVDDSPISSDDTIKTNPGTGANDMVGTAAALAVLSLAGAGAVAFKKASK